MKKQMSKLSVKADKIVNLSKQQAQNVNGARPKLPTRTETCTDYTCPPPATY